MNWWNCWNLSSAHFGLLNKFWKSRLISLLIHDARSVSGIESIIGAYKNSLQYVEMSQPTLFDPLFKEVIKLGQESMKKGGLDYVVIVVMTDGEIHDMKSVIDTVIQASRLPISIIIIGIGQASFAKMQCLDGNQGLVNSKGEKWERDMVSFLEFKKQISDFV